MNSGTLYQIFARLSFVLSSYGLHIVLAYFIEDITDYGRLGVIFSMMSLARIFLTTGLPQSVARDIAANEDKISEIYRTAFDLQLFLGFGILGIYICGAPLWTRILDDPSLMEMILVSSLAIPFTALFQIEIAWLTGKRRFGKQSIVMSWYALGRFLLALGLFFVGLGVMGVLWAIVVTTALCGVYLFHLVPLPPRTGTTRRTGMLKAASPYMVSSFAIVALLNCDMLLLKHFFPDDPLVGYYAGAVNIGKLPFFVFLAFARTMLPTVTKKLSSGDKAGAVEYTQKEMASLLSLLILGCALVAASSAQILDFIYPVSFVAASRALSILFCASCGLTLMQVMLALYGAIDRIGTGAKIVAACIPFQLVVGYILTPLWGAEGVAMANALAAAVGIFLLSLILRKEFGKFLRPLTLVSCLIAGGSTWVFLRFAVPEFPLLLLPFRMLIGCVFFYTVLFVIDVRFREMIKGYAACVQKKFKRANFS